MHFGSKNIIWNFKHYDSFIQTAGTIFVYKTIKTHEWWYTAGMIL